MGLARERKGSPPQVIAHAVTRALTVRRPRAHYLVGKDSRSMAVLAAALPTPLLDRLRRRIGDQPAPDHAPCLAGPEPVTIRQVIQRFPSSP